MAFTVIGYYESTGQTFAHHVYARTGLQAFRVCAENEIDDVDDAVFVVAIAGFHYDTDALEFPGEGVVDAVTVLTQDDVFGGELS